MVSIDNRSLLLQRVHSEEKLHVLYLLFRGDHLNIDDNDRSEADVVYYRCAKAISEGDRVQFNENYLRISMRVITKESASPFIYDDFLVFVLLVGLKKFAMEGKWMASVIDARSRTPTTLTFEGILNNNVLGTNIQPEVRYIFECLVTNDKVNENLSLSAWKSICSNSNLLDSRDDFLSIVRLVAFDSIIERNILIDNARTSLYESFAIKFTKRSKYFAWFLSTGALSFVLFELVTLLEANSTLQATVGNFGTILGIFGISALGNSIGVFRRFVHRLVALSLGMPKPLISGSESHKALKSFNHDEET